MRRLKGFCASAFCSLALFSSACGDKAGAAPPRRTAATFADASEATRANETALTDASEATRANETALTDPYETADPVAAKSIGHTSYVLKLRLEGGQLAAYKPRSTLSLGDRRYKGEIAAYRVARALGLSNVPRAVPRAFDSAKIESAFAIPADKTEFEKRALVDPGGRLRGAIIPWIARYEEVPMEQPRQRAEWTAWLTREGAAPEGADRRTAAAVSTMLAFDYITANWDRWSGGNVARDGENGTILFVDNDGAFYEHPPASELGRQLALLRRVLRFSRSFVSALRSFGVSRLRDALGQEAPGEALLSNHVILATEARRRTLLRTIDDRIARSGESATLVFE